MENTQITSRYFLLDSDAVPREVLDGHGVDSFLLVVVHHGNLDRAKNHKYNLESILESLTLNYLAETGNFSLTSFISASVWSGVPSSQGFSEHFTARKRNLKPSRTTTETILKYLTEIGAALQLRTEGVPDVLPLHLLSEAEVHGVEEDSGGGRVFTGEKLSSVPVVVTGSGQHQGTHCRTEVSPALQHHGLLSQLTIELGEAFFVRAL